MLTFLSSYNFTSFYSPHEIEFLWPYSKQAIFEATQFSTPRISRRSHERPKWFTSDLKHQLNCIHSFRRRQSKNLLLILKTSWLDLQNKKADAKGSLKPLGFNTFPPLIVVRFLSTSRQSLNLAFYL